VNLQSIRRIGEERPEGEVATLPLNVVALWSSAPLRTESVPRPENRIPVLSGRNGIMAIPFDFLLDNREHVSYTMSLECWATGRLRLEMEGAVRAEEHPGTNKANTCLQNREEGSVTLPSPRLPACRWGGSWSEGPWPQWPCHRSGKMQEQSRQPIESKGREPGNLRTWRAPCSYCAHKRRFLFDLPVESLLGACKRGRAQFHFSYLRPFFVTKNVTLQNESLYVLENKREGK
jgi:hypothetical protein